MELGRCVLPPPGFWRVAQSLPASDAPFTSQPSILQIKPVEIAIVKFLVQHHIELRRLEHAQQLWQVVPFTPGCPRTVGDLAPLAEPRSTLPNPAASWVCKLQPTPANFQVTQQLLIFRFHHLCRSVVQR